MTNTGTDAIYNEQSRNIIIRVMKYFKEERNKYSNLLKTFDHLSKRYAHKDAIVISLETFEEIHLVLNNMKSTSERTATATGISLQTVTHIQKEYRLAEANSPRTITALTKRQRTNIQKEYRLAEANPPRTITAPTKRKRKPKLLLNNYELRALKKIISTIEEKEGRTATMNKIWLRAKRDLKFVGGKAKLSKLIETQLGLCFKKCNVQSSKGFQLAEDLNIKAARIHYLQKIAENTALGLNKRDVVYFGKHVGSITDPGGRENNQENTYIILHAGTESGLIDEALDVWIKESSDRSKLSATEFFMWFNKKLLPNIYEQSIIVTDDLLFTIIQDTEGNSNKDILNNLVKSNGHEILYLPQLCCDLNPMVNIWKRMKTNSSQSNILGHNLKDIITEMVDSLTPYVWHSVMSTVKRQEQKTNENEVGKVSDIVISSEEGSDDCSTDEEQNMDLDSERNGAEQIDPECVNFLEVQLEG